MKKAKKPTHEVRAAEAEITVSSTMFGQETEEVRTVPVRPFIENAPVGSVTVKQGRTINLGNYESARIDVAFTVPGYVGELVDLFHDTVREVDKLLSARVDEIEHGLNVPPAQEDSLEDLLNN